MKVYFNVDSITDNCSNKCIAKPEKAYLGIGSIGCQRCPFCYGSGNTEKTDYVVMTFDKEGHPHVRNKYNYVMCSAFYKKPSLKIKLRLFLYHNLYLPIGDFYCKIKYNFFKKYD